MSTAQPPSLDPGWYGDPNGGDSQRWWNGRTWTSDSRPLEPTTPEKSPTAPENPVADASASVVSAARIHPTNKPRTPYVKVASATAAHYTNTLGIPYVAPTVHEPRNWFAIGCMGTFGILMVLPLVGLTFVLVSLFLTAFPLFP